MKKNNDKVVKPKQARLSQSDVPSYSLDEALQISKAIAENYASDPTTPLEVAAALGVSPTTGPFRMRTGASIAYGLTEGGSNATVISITDLAKRIISPQKEGDDIIASREALLKPKVIGEFLHKYDGNQIPKDGIACNVLISMGVPKDRASDILSQIVESADKLGLLKDIKSKKYVNLRPTVNRTNDNEAYSVNDELHSDSDINNDTENQTILPNSIDTNIIIENDKKKKRVFITHGKNKGFVEPIKKLLSFGELEPIVSVERQSVSQPVPEKVMDDMRYCGSAIIHVEDEQTLIDKDANEHVMLNPNVLIEIGAAMALYKKRFILLVKDGVKLPSNLQGLFEVRYSGETLDGDTTIKLLEAIREMKKL